MNSVNTQPSHGDSFEWVRQKADEAQANKEQRAATTSRQLFLPGFDIGAMPNHLNRSSLIAPIARGHRKFHRQTVMVSRRDCVLEYTGEQLDEADGEIIMALIFFARPYALSLGRYLHLLEDMKSAGVNSCDEVLAAIAEKAIQVTA
ncbi:MAG: hypothetical protein V4554_09345 [Pseudomonadota bacterium]